MYYPKSPCCPDNGSGENKCVPNGCCPVENNDSKKELLLKIQELTFAAYDLQQFLDTHPDDKQALELFTQVSATAQSMILDYENMYGPLKAGSSPNEIPFMWVDDEYDWPWVKMGED